jgi:hypothetical protein
VKYERKSEVEVGRIGIRAGEMEGRSDGRQGRQNGRKKKK